MMYVTMHLRVPTTMLLKTFPPSVLKSQEDFPQFDAETKHCIAI